MAKHSSPTIWVLLDSAKGHQNQALGVADQLGWNYDTKKLVYTLFVRTPNWMKFPAFGQEALGLHPKLGDALAPPWPELVIACGRKTAPVARYIKYKAGKDANGLPNCRIAQIMWPSAPVEPYDMIAVPTHDRLGEKQAGLENIQRVLGAPHRVTAKRLRQAKKDHADQLGTLNHPVVTLLIGGDTKRSSFKLLHARELIQTASLLVSETGGKLLVSTSRRTPKKAVEVIKEQLQWHAGNHVFYHPDETKANPYYAFLAASDAIVVTGDTISMLSEACGTGKPVFVYSPSGYAPPKHERFQQALAKAGYVMPFAEDTVADMKRVISAGKTRQPLNPAEEIATKIKKWFD